MTTVTSPSTNETIDDNAYMILEEFSDELVNDQPKIGNFFFLLFYRLCSFPRFYSLFPPIILQYFRVFID